MKKNKKGLIVLSLIVVMGISILSSCGKKDVADPDSQIQTETNADQTGEEGSMKELPIYCINDESLEREPVIAVIPKDSEITPELVVDTVVDKFLEHSLDIGIDTVAEDGDKVVVSFQADKAPLTGVGAGVEETILDSISMSLLDNVASCQKVIFQVEGSAYESGHMVFEKDEVYKSLNK